jgi:hypothetical protein
MILVRPMLRLLIIWHPQRPPVPRTWPTETPGCSETDTNRAREFTLVSSTGRIICVSSSLTLNFCSAFALEDGIAGCNAAAGSAHQLAESASPVLLTSEEASRVLTDPTATPTSEGPAPQMSNGTSQGSITTPSTPVPNGQPEVVATNRKRSAEAEETPEQRRKRINNEYSRRHHQRKKQELTEARENVKRLEDANGVLTHKNAALQEINGQLWRYINQFPPLGRGKASSGDQSPDASSEDVGIAPVAHPHAAHKGGEQGPHGGGAE